MKPNAIVDQEAEGSARIPSSASVWMITNFPTLPQTIFGSNLVAVSLLPASDSDKESLPDLLFITLAPFLLKSEVSSAAEVVMMVFEEAILQTFVSSEVSFPGSLPILTLQLKLRFLSALHCQYTYIIYT